MYLISWIYHVWSVDDEASYFSDFSVQKGNANE